MRDRKFGLQTQGDDKTRPPRLAGARQRRVRCPPARSLPARPSGASGLLQPLHYHAQPFRGRIGGVRGKTSSPVQSRDEIL